MSLWIELLSMFDNAVQNKDNDLTKRMLQYASWCFSRNEEKASGDVVNAVACAFYEHLPQRENYRPLLSSWFFPHEFENLLPVFCYHLSEQELDELKKVFYGTQKTPGNG